MKRKPNPSRASPAAAKAARGAHRANGAKGAQGTNGATVAHGANGTNVALARPRKPRGRPRSFDRAAALGQAIEVFWTKGYEATSISDLTAAMSINPPSLYAAFGDKERLFLEAVERYEAMQGDSCPYCTEPTARGAMEKLLNYMADELTSKTHPRGCMLLMAAATSSGASPQMQAAIARRRAENRKMMKARIEQGIEDGDVPPGTDAASLCDFYVTIINGMSMQARDGATKKSLMATVERAMSLFPRAGGTAARSAAAGRKKEIA